MSLARLEPINHNDKSAEGNSGQDIMATVWGFLEPWWHTDVCITILTTTPVILLCYGDTGSQCLMTRKCDPEAVYITDESTTDKSTTDESTTDESTTDERRMLVNGTRLKNREKMQIHDGCRISFGPYKHFIFHHMSKPAEQSIPPPFPSTSPHEAKTDPLLTPTLAALFTTDMSLWKGFNTVVRARYNRTGNVYALKMVFPKPSYVEVEVSGLSPSYLARWRARASANSGHTSPSGTDDLVPLTLMKAYAEMRNMRLCHHPNVCKIFGSFFDEGSGVYTLILEYVNGGDLFDYINRYKNGMPEADAKQIGYQICSGMAYVHGRGIMHRDLKPHNILLTQDTPPRVKIADFGYSKRTDKYNTSNTNRRELVCGSATYAAPEILTEQYDHLVDSFSVGVIIHEMLTGTLPHSYGEEDEDKERVKEGEAKEAKQESENNFDFERLVQERVLDLKYLDERNLSDDACSIITALLANAPEERLSMSDALQNPWFHEKWKTKFHKLIRLWLKQCKDLRRMSGE
ncbi:kinase-like protein [Pholiota conissans]|uniref:Kinase-like protein n=1 Tax=Pholiota conissans TaxID=109636 RepID=A0A9P5YX55_9AGAR|nr:kinase-like protein [Pholiota conissans]